jgi:hypothetical protein
MDMSKEEAEGEGDEEDQGDKNLGPAHKQCLPTHLAEMAEAEDGLKTCGVQVHDSTPFMSESDEKVRDDLSELKEASTSKTANMNWPSVSTCAVSEYDSGSKLMCKAFPWLFPGGRGGL